MTQITMTAANSSGRGSRYPRQADRGPSADCWWTWRLPNREVLARGTPFACAPHLRSLMPM